MDRPSVAHHRVSHADRLSHRPAGDTPSPWYGRDTVDRGGETMSVKPEERSMATGAAGAPGTRPTPEEIVALAHDDHCEGYASRVVITVSRSPTNDQPRQYRAVSLRTGASTTRSRVASRRHTQQRTGHSLRRMNTSCGKAASTKSSTSSARAPGPSSTPKSPGTFATR